LNCSSGLCENQTLSYSIGRFLDGFGPVNESFSLHIEPGLCSNSSSPCNFPRELDSFCRFDSVVVNGFVDDQGLLICRAPNMSIADEKVWRTVVVDIAFGDGEYTSSGRLFTFYDRNHAPHLRADTTRYLFLNGRSTKIGPFAVDDQDLAIERYAHSFQLQLQVSAQHGTVAVNTSVGKSVVVFATLSSLNQILSDGIEYEAEAGFFGHDTVTVRVDDMGTAGLGGNLSDSVQVDVMVLADNPQPAVFVLNGLASVNRSTKGFVSMEYVNGPINVYEFEGKLDPKIRQTESQNASVRVRPHQDCTIFDDELGIESVFPCVAIISDLVISDSNYSPDNRYVVNLSSTLPSGHVGVRDVGGLHFHRDIRVGQSVEFSGSLRQINLALSMLSFRSYAEDKCVHFLELRVGARVNSDFVLHSSSSISRTAEGSGGWVARDVYDEMGKTLDQAPTIVFDFQSPLIVERVVLDLFDSNRPRSFTLEMKNDASDVSLHSSGWSKEIEFDIEDAEGSAGPQAVFLDRDDIFNPNGNYAYGARFWRITFTSAWNSADLRFREVSFWYFGPGLHEDLVQVVTVQLVNDAPTIELLNASSGIATFSGLEDEAILLPGFVIRGNPAPWICDPRQ